MPLKLNIPNKVANSFVWFVVLAFLVVGTFAYTTYPEVLNFAAPDPANVPSPGHGSTAIVVNIGGVDLTLQEAIDDRNISTYTGGASEDASNIKFLDPFEQVSFTATRPLPFPPIIRQPVTITTNTDATGAILNISASGTISAANYANANCEQVLELYTFDDELVGKFFAHSKIGSDPKNIIVSGSATVPLIAGKIRVDRGNSTLDITECNDSLDVEITVVGLIYSLPVAPFVGPMPQ